MIVPRSLGEDEAPTAIGAYIFAGGFTLGVSKHFRVKAHLEGSWYGVKTSQLNFPGLDAYVKSPLWPLEQLHGRHDTAFLYCNPPCAPFSQAGATMRGGTNAWKTDPRLKCWKECFVAFEALQPTVFAVESVVRAYTAGEPFIRGLEELVHQMGYSTTHVFVDAKNFGMAQKRKRYFFVAHKVEMDFDRPTYLHPVVNDILATVTDPGYIPRWKDKSHEALVPFLPSHASFRAMWEELYDSSECERNAQGGVVGRPRIFIHRVDGEDLIGTITGDYFVHPTEDRFLGMNELKVLNGFPQDYWLEGPPGGHASLLARGVCPDVAEWLAGRARAAVDRGVPIGEPTSQEVDWLSR